MGIAGLGAMSALSGLSGLTGMLNATNSQSDNWGNSWGSSSNWGTSSGNAWSKSQNVADAYAQSRDMSESQSWGESYNRVYGSEASAKAIDRATEANQIQKDLWSMQAEYNAKQAEVDREFQAAMSNTAYQRAVVDLLRAGLNPILAVGNMGASTPAGAMASSGLASSHMAQTFADSEGYSNSGSTAYSRGESESRSHSEGTSKSKSKQSSKSGGSSNQGSHNEGHSTSTTQLKDLINSLTGLLNAGSDYGKGKASVGGGGGGGGGGAY